MDSDVEAQSRPALNAYSHSEDKCRTAVTIKRHAHSHSKFLSPEDAINDIYDIFDGMRGPEASPSPPSVVGSVRSAGAAGPRCRHTHHNTRVELAPTHSVLQTFRSWMAPTSRHLSSLQQQDSARAGNINMFLKMAGFTAHSAGDDFVDILRPLSELAMAGSSYVDEDVELDLDFVGIDVPSAFAMGAGEQDELGVCHVTGGGVRDCGV